MAMLAGPKRRNRYNLTPRGKPLFEDDTRYGTKMLEKMGWSKGKGLGANENGSQDFVRVRLRNTHEGLGFEDRDDLWTQHEQSFSGLLKKLNVDDDDIGGKAEGNASDEGEMSTVGFGFSAAQPVQNKEKLKDKFSGESLEEKSKRSKVRVHYKKFTKGKDLTQYSEKDLANIFGKKVVEEQQANGIYEQFTAITVLANSDEKEESDEKEVDANFAGVSTIPTKLSVTDYFKIKMEEMKNRRNNMSTPQLGKETNINDVEEGVDVNIEIKQKKRASKQQEISKKKKRKLNELKDEDDEKINSVEETEVKVLKKKRKENNVNEASLIDNSAENINKSSSKKPKEKVNVDDEIEIKEVETSINIEKTSAKKKSKCKKIKDKSFSKLDTNTENGAVNSSTNSEHIQNANSISENNTKKTKKSKNIQQKEVSKTNDQQETAVNGTHITTTEAKATVNKSKNSKKAESAIDYSSLTLNELKAKLTAYDTYTISQFCAEKFRNIDFDLFHGAILSQIPGYSFNEDLKLDIQVIKGDEARITQLWNCTFNKYSNASPKGAYYNYTKQVWNARKAKNQKMPRFSVKTWKRKNAFQGI